MALNPNFWRNTVEASVGTALAACARRGSVNLGAWNNLVYSLVSIPRIPDPERGTRSIPPAFARLAPPGIDHVTCNGSPSSPHRLRRFGGARNC